jgi:hypothetical protein
VKPWTLVLDQALYDSLMEHLYPGDHDEHGAVIAAGIAESDRGTRLIGRELHIAMDGVEFVPGRRGYRMLTGEFVRDKIRYCRDRGLIYLAVHNHGGEDAVGFSDPDLRSHERGYPALLDISGRPVGALVLARNAIAGDVWTPDRARRPIRDTVIVGRNLARLYPEPPPPPPTADETYDRQVRWFGDRGQELLSQLKVGVVGAGGVGLPLITMLGRLGVGELVAIDPDRVDPTNLPRMPEASCWDAMAPLRFHSSMKPLADRLSTRKIDLARRAVRRANRKARFKGLAMNVTEPPAAHELVDCDFIFLAADSHLARMLVNAIAYQYFIPCIQLGSRIDVDQKSGEVGDIRGNARLILPSIGCLRCHQMISPTRLQEEARDPDERERNRYIAEVPAPSVITFNTALASQAATDFLLMNVGLLEQSAPLDYLRSRPRRREMQHIVDVTNRHTCSDCGTVRRSRRARGDSVELPLPER